MAVETALAAHRDVSEFLKDCTKRMGVVGTFTASCRR
jgi:hypothetical protein